MKKRLNFTLSPEAVEILRELAKKMGLSMSAVLEISIRKEKKQEHEQPQS